jgi:aminoglycoside 6'-N-acetyltransferase I
MRIRLAEPGDWGELATMRALLWPSASAEEHLAEIKAAVAAPGQQGFPVVVFVSEDDGFVTGFLEVGLRSHADGCDPARAVGFVEGWFVHLGHRGRGIGRELMLAAEAWARSQGCVEMASDALMENRESESAHQALGFEVVDRCVHFRKVL